VVLIIWSDFGTKHIPVEIAEVTAEKPFNYMTSV